MSLNGFTCRDGKIFEKSASLTRLETNVFPTQPLPHRPISFLDKFAFCPIYSCENACTVAQQRAQLCKTSIFTEQTSLCQLLVEYLFSNRETNLSNGCATVEGNLDRN